MSVWLFIHKFEGKLSSSSILSNHYPSESIKCENKKSQKDKEWNMRRVFGGFPTHLMQYIPSQCKPGNGHNSSSVSVSWRL